MHRLAFFYTHTVILLVYNDGDHNILYYQHENYGKTQFCLLLTFHFFFHLDSRAVCNRTSTQTKIRYLKVQVKERNIAVMQQSKLSDESISVVCMYYQGCSIQGTFRDLEKWNGWKLEPLFKNYRYFEMAVISKQPLF